MVEREIAALAGRQHGVISRVQLRELGLGTDAIDYRQGRGRLHAIHRGVYAVGHRALSIEGRWLAATLACGPDAVLSHHAAAALWGLVPTQRERIDVTVGRARATRARIALHRVPVAADERTAVHGIPVTTPARTLVDLAGVVTPHRLERAIEHAERLRLADATGLSMLLGRCPHRRGMRALRAIVSADQIGTTPLRGDLEDHFIAFLDAADLPRPQTNVPFLLESGRCIEVDCLWRMQRLIVELDDHASHGTRRAFERDRARDRQLQVAGWRTVRITARQLADDPGTLADELRLLLTPAAGDEGVARTYR